MLALLGLLIMGFLIAPSCSRAPTLSTSCARGGSRARPGPVAASQTERTHAGLSVVFANYWDVSVATHAR